MSTDEKPSKNENEYFLLRDAEWLKERRALLDAERRNRDASAAATSPTSPTSPTSAATPAGMRCPRCGGALVSRSFHHVMIDVCQSCNGVWLDAGELEMLGAVSHAEYESLVRSLHNA